MLEEEPESDSSGSSEGETKEFLYLRLELCDRLNLQGWLDNLDTDYNSVGYKMSAFKILEGLASALAYLHGQYIFKLLNGVLYGTLGTVGRLNCLPKKSSLQLMSDRLNLFQVWAEMVISSRV